MLSENSPKSKFCHSCRIHNQNSSKHDRIFQKLTFPIKEVFLLFFLENCLFLLFFFCVNRPIFQSSRSVDLKRFFPLTLGWRPTHLGDFHLVSIYLYNPGLYSIQLLPYFQFGQPPKKLLCRFTADFYCSLTCTRPL